MVQKRLLAGLAMNKVQKKGGSNLSFKGGSNSRSHQRGHDPFSKQNFYKKVSKYDLDRGFIDTQAYSRGKKAVLTVNAANKREIINGEI